MKTIHGGYFLVRHQRRKHLTLRVFVNPTKKSHFTTLQSEGNLNFRAKIQH